MLMKYSITSILLAAEILFSSNNYAQKKTVASSPVDSLWKTETFNGMNFRCIGTAVTSGRVVDFAVNPNNIKEYFVAAASGGVWKTSNGGITYDPVFEREGSYSIGC